MARTNARELCDLILDDGSFVSWDTEPLAVPAGPEYAAELAAARAATGCDESVLTGAGTVSGRPVAVVASEFDFLAGSIGVAAAERITEAITRATDAGLPLLASPASGGTRMQEGTVAFLQMVKITAAVARHKAAHLPYLVYLRHPTTGGVFASWGSLGHITVAEPGALIGFLGPRVYEQLYGHPFPAGVQTAENLQRLDRKLRADLPAASESSRLPVIVTVRPGTQHGSMLRLRGEGVPQEGSAAHRGDLYVKVLVRV
ncbi:MAG TPA: carboxyl transferase domain-containing protein, partial [Mycolicibacterium fallax]|nr:carboxyl transferase domain-containing protein [Mycolicibacterium fallax]